MKKKSIIFWLIGIVMVILCAFSVYKLVSYYDETNREARAFQELSNQVSQAMEELQDTEKDQIRKAYVDLYKQNPDLFGWLKIEDTSIDYPVMYTPEEPEYYLHRAFDKTYSSSGVPFLDGNCYEGGGNYLIYGHNIKRGSMFSVLLSYEEKSFWQKHPVIVFDTLYEHSEYEVIAAFYSRIYTDDTREGFRYYQYTDLSDKTVFDKYLSQVQDSALYDTGISASYGDTLLTLSTCAYHTENGRFVVVAKKSANK